MAKTPGIFHMPRPSFRERRDAQSQPNPGAPMPAQPNLNLSEPIIGVGERTGRTYFRAGEVPEKITFTPTAPGTPPVPSPGQGPGMYNEFGQYNAPASVTKPVQPMPFASGGTANINPGGMSNDPLQQMLQQFLATSQLQPQDVQDLTTATNSLVSEVGLGKMTPEQAQQAFQHFTSSFAPPAPTSQPPMQAPGADPGAGSYPPDDNSTNFGTPWSQQPGAADNTPGHLMNQGGLTAGVVPGFNPKYETRADAGNAAAANAATIQQMQAIPPSTMTPPDPSQVYGPPVPSGASAPSATAPTPPAPSAPPTSATAAPQRPPVPMYNIPNGGYGVGPANKVPGNPAIPILSNSPRAHMMTDAGPQYKSSATPNATTPPPAGANVTSDFSDPAFAQIQPPDKDGITHIPDYVHGGTGLLDAASVAAITSTFPPQFVQQALHIAAAESKGSNAATGKAGEVGLFQIHPVNWPALSTKLGIPINAQTLKDPMTNAKAAAQILKDDGGTWSDWTTAKTVLTALGVGNSVKAVNALPAFN